jgi:urease accessory protein
MPTQTGPSLTLTPRVNGCLALTFEHSPTRQQTLMRVTHQTPPLRVVRGFQNQAGAALAHLHNISGGVLGGDALSVTARIGPGSQAQLTTPGATRIYRHRAGGPEAIQENHFVVEAGGLLEYLPDPLIPFALARYRQITKIRLGAGSGLFWWEIVAPGRETRGEVFAYDLVEMQTDIWVGRQPIALERLRLEPQLKPLSSPLRLGPYRYFCTFYICHTAQADQGWLDLEQELWQLLEPHSLGQASAWAVNRLPRHGLVIKGLSDSSQALQATLLTLWQTAKQRLYQAPAIFPRKMY